MLIPVRSSQFKRDVKKARARGKDLSKLRVLLEWEQGTRRVSGPAETLLRVIAHDPNAVRRALLG